MDQWCHNIIYNLHCHQEFNLYLFHVKVVFYWLFLKYYIIMSVSIYRGVSREIRYTLEYDRGSLGANDRYYNFLWGFFTKMVKLGFTQKLLIVEK